jgi:MFS transporter, DHA1 family, multidrug resistance protein
VLVAVTATGPLVMHILVPALPLAAADLGGLARYDTAGGHALISSGIISSGIAGGQLLYGPVSDKFGRRPTLVSLCLYVIASALAGWASGIATLLIPRIGQAVSGCGGLVLGRAIVRDSAAAGQAASRMALLTMVQSLAPGIGPAAGGFLGAWFGWRSIFVRWGHSVLSRWRRMAGIAGDGSIPRHRRLGAHARQLSEPAALPLLSRLHVRRRFTSTSFYAYLTALPLIFTQMLHRPATKVGLYYLAVMSGVPIGSFASSRLASRVRLTLLLRATSAIAVLGTALFFAAAVSGMLNLATVLGPMILFSVGVGACGPVAITSAISADPQMIGAASGLYGFTQMANDALCTLVVGIFPANPALSAASVLLAGTLFGQYFFLRATRTRSGASA